jgi:prepilin-type N-terminal cleavage/methylation domain-containing protein
MIMKQTHPHLTSRPISHSPAFTMLELVFVIVIVGILAALAIPRLDRDLKQEASDTILSAVRYTQQLALMDNKQSFSNPKWQQRYWKIMFGTCATSSNKFFMIGSDNNMDSNGFFESTEAAMDPLSGKPYFWVNGTDCSSGKDSNVSNNIFLSHRFGITNFAFTGGCSGVQYIGFDHLGRPRIGFGVSNTPDHASYMSSACIMTFTLSDGDTFAISIEPETGYAQIVGQPDS